MVLTLGQNIGPNRGIVGHSSAHHGGCWVKPGSLLDNSVQTLKLHDFCVGWHMAIVCRWSSEYVVYLFEGLKIKGAVKELFFWVSLKMSGLLHNK